MTEPILEPGYWARRLREAAVQHHAVFRCPLDRWQRIEDKHRAILARVVNSGDFILDAGCGWGRLLTLMPPTWFGAYVGIDLSPAFIQLARTLHPLRRFEVGDLRTLLPMQAFDLGVLISIRPMVIRNCGQETWDQMNDSLRSCCKRLLFLEYDENGDGSVE